MLYFQELQVNTKVSEFMLHELTEEEQSDLYGMFVDSYTKAVGAAWDEDKFYSLAGNWIFFGNADPNGGGGIAVRKQNQLKAFKLNACYGNPLAIIAGFNLMLRSYPSMPVWGAMTPDLVNTILKREKDFKVVPIIVLKATFPFLKNISPDIVGLGSKGIKVNTPVGVMEKVVVGNTAYFKKIFDMTNDPDFADKVPAVARIALKPAVAILRMLAGIKKSDLATDDAKQITDESVIPGEKKPLKEIEWKTMAVEEFAALNGNQVVSVHLNSGKNACSHTVLSTLHVFSGGHIVISDPKHLAQTELWMSSVESIRYRDEYGKLHIELNFRGGGFAMVSVIRK